MAKAKNPGQIGQRLKTLRKEKGYTLAYVADRTGISQSTLSKLENGQTQLTFTSVNKLAQGLGLSISSLTSQHPEHLTARRSVTRKGEGTPFQAKDVEYQILCDDLADKDQVYQRVTVMAHSIADQQEWRRHPGKEFIFVLKGTLVLHTEAYAPLVLEQGDCVVFDCNMGHKYVSRGEEDAELLMTMQLQGYTDVTEALEDINTPPDF
jgi:transcriptional regulator with XRE-family HTH domain